LEEPTWHLTDEAPSSIAQELPAIVECLLRLAEEVYATSLIKQETPIALEIVEIPEAERDPKAPVRFNVQSVNPRPAA
jgi:hypothetical protein